MRVLRFVGPGDDADHLIVETADGGEQFLLQLDEAIREAVGSPRSAAAAAQPDAAPETAPDTVAEAPPDTAISPREIQMRVRAGAQPQQLADDHAMTLEKVLRFAGPVLAERTRISDEARRAKARRSTTEGQVVVFGEAVEERFAAHGIDPATITWDAYRRDDGQWIVTAGWVGGSTERVAEWVFHLAGRTVTPLDDTAADLLSDRPIRSAAPSGEPARPSLVAAPPLAPGVVAFPPMPDADTGPIPTAAELDEVYDQDSNSDALDRDARRRIVAGGEAARRLPRAAVAAAAGRVERGRDRRRGRVRPGVPDRANRPAAQGDQPGRGQPRGRDRRGTRGPGPHPVLGRHPAGRAPQERLAVRPAGHAARSPRTCGRDRAAIAKLSRSSPS